MVIFLFIYQFAFTRKHYSNREIEQTSVKRFVPQAGILLWKEEIFFHPKVGEFCCMSLGWMFVFLPLDNSVCRQMVWSMKQYSHTVFGMTTELNLSNLRFMCVLTAYSTFYIIGLVLSMQIPFVGFQPIRTSEHMAAAGQWSACVCVCVYVHGRSVLWLKMLLEAFNYSFGVTV